MSGPDSAGAKESRTLSGLFDRPLTSFHLLLVTTGALTLIGMVMVLSASSIDSYTATHSVFSVFYKQVMWLALGIPAFWLGMRLPPKQFRRLAYPALIIAFFALLAVLVPGIGYTTGGSQRWIVVGPLQLQPSEPAKLALALWGADLLVRKRKLLGQPRHLLIPLLPVAGALAMLVMAEPDLGTTLCFVVILFALLWTVGAPMRIFGAMLTLAVGAVVALIIAEPYRLARLTSFMDPFSQRSGDGYQAVNGLYALGSGGWFGLGLGESRYKWGMLPAAHTDYIFAILGEELGLVGSLLVLGLFATLAYAGFRVARRTTDPFIRLVSAAVTTWLSAQALINIGYVAGMLPVTGIPLPLISFGGTSLIITLFGLGMLTNFARHEPEAVATLTAKGRGRVARLLLIPAPDLEYLAPPRRRQRRRPTSTSPSRQAQRPRQAQHPRPVSRAPRSAVRPQLRPTGTEGSSGR
ncbi:MAG TPA: putative lipid II flippase FtsW [Mycobacteriales bacterium]|nr:putative lipid II flippase FtsW [Mycobacteriales bacterium]